MDKGPMSSKRTREKEHSKKNRGGALSEICTKIGTLTEILGFLSSRGSRRQDTFLHSGKLKSKADVVVKEMPGNNVQVADHQSLP